MLVGFVNLWAPRGTPYSLTSTQAQERWPGAGWADQVCSSVASGSQTSPYLLCPSAPSSVRRGAGLDGEGGLGSEAGSRAPLFTTWQPRSKPAVPGWWREGGKGQAKGSTWSFLRVDQSGWRWQVWRGVPRLGASRALCLANDLLLGYKGLLSSSEREGLWGGGDSPEGGRLPRPPPRPMGGGASRRSNGPMIHRWALVCANWLCRPPDSWQGAGLSGTPVSLPRLPPRMAAWGF